MGAWGFGIYDNDDASDVLFDIQGLAIKYYNKQKKKLNVDELLVVADILLKEEFSIDYDVFHDLYTRIKDLADKEYFLDWNEPSERKRVVKNILGRLRKLIMLENE